MRVKPLIKVFLLLMLLLSPLYEGLASADVNVFVYHRFGNSKYPSTNISTDVFIQQLELLRDEKYQVLTLGDVVGRLRSGQQLPKKCAVLTIDDAFISFYTVGMPLLKKFGFPATVFVNTDGIGGPGYMSWAQLRDVAAAGIEIGNHSAAHDYLVEWQEGEDEAAWLARIRADLMRAQSAFKTNLGSELRLFAYPYGEYEPRLQMLVAELGFVAAVAQQSGVVSNISDRYALPRFPMGGPFATLKGFRNKLKMTALRVKVMSPASPVAQQNPPSLKVQVVDSDVDLGRLNCFVDGSDRCKIERSGEGGKVLSITTDAPLMSRRGKFTLTAPNRRTGRWHWFSQLWVFPKGDGVR